MTDVDRPGFEDQPNRKLARANNYFEPNGYIPMAYTKSSRKGYSRKGYNSGSYPASLRVAAAASRRKRFSERNGRILEAAQALVPLYNEPMDIDLARKYVGRGAYWGRSLGAMAGGLAGGAADAYLGTSGLASLGRKYGGSLGDRGSDILMNKLRGRGDYSVQANSMFPQSGNTGFDVTAGRRENGDIVITNCEFITEVKPTTAEFHTVLSTKINPGLRGCFPWLSQMAAAYEEYEMIQCVFEFRSTVTGGNSTAAGTITMTTQVKPNAADFTSIQVMRAYDEHSHGGVTDTILHGVECDPSQRTGSAVEYIRTGEMSSTDDLAKYDLGAFQAVTSGCAANLSVGEIWVHYKVLLKKSKMILPGSITASSLLFSTLYGNYAASTTANSLFGSTTRTFFGAQNTLLSGGHHHDRTNAFTIGPLNTLTFPSYITEGKFLVNVKWVSNSAVSPGAIVILNQVGCLVTFYDISPEPQAAVNSYDQEFIVSLNSPGLVAASFGFSYNAGASVNVLSTTAFMVRVSQMDADMKFNTGILG